MYLALAGEFLPSAPPGTSYSSHSDRCIAIPYCGLSCISLITNNEHPFMCSVCLYRIRHIYVYESWIFIGKTDAEAEAPILCPPDSKSQLIGKSFPDVGKDWRQKEKGTAEDEMIGWHHWLNGNEFWQTPGDSEGQGSLAAAVHGVTKSGTRLKDWTTTNTTILISVAFTKFLFLCAQFVYVPFICLTVLAYSMMLNTSDVSLYLCLILDLSGKASSFLKLSMML